MEQNLNYFRELIRIMEPKFYEHLTKHVDAMELLFCHRWILLCFKREFQTEAALSIWESCWSSYATEYFHLFVCLAIVSVYGNDVV
ncbi:TBC1 domain family member 16-like [Diaphorina citri]|uniref:TBC1 domain family member 16-like n=1 Tax=Diaphorina citri TaxID=121845 RepID=A0A1S4EG19_DIACI|nr:TBC1 domain family member 16-like [Diaphorina citri]